MDGPHPTLHSNPLASHTHASRTDCTGSTLGNGNLPTVGNLIRLHLCHHRLSWLGAGRERWIALYHQHDMALKRATFAYGIHLPQERCDNWNGQR